MKKKINIEQDCIPITTQEMLRNVLVERYTMALAITKNFLRASSTVGEPKCIFCNRYVLMFDMNHTSNCPVRLAQEIIKESNPSCQSTKPKPKKKPVRRSGK